jgi:hypothetical protein
MMEQSPWDYAPDLAEKLRCHLTRILNALSDLDGL